MSHVWCHGPSCHTYKTQDRVRGHKGSKVLRTRKVKLGDPNYRSMYSYFCSQGCYNEFANTHVEQIIRIAPRIEPLETRIEDPVREKSEYGYYYNRIKERGVDKSME